VPSQPVAPILPWAQPWLPHEWQQTYPLKRAYRPLAANTRFTRLPARSGRSPASARSATPRLASPLPGPVAGKYRHLAGAVAVRVVILYPPVLGVFLVLEDLEWWHHMISRSFRTRAQRGGMGFAPGLTDRLHFLPRPRLRSHRSRMVLCVCASQRIRHMSAWPTSRRPAGDGSWPPMNYPGQLH
jgi:hypothetical protein